MSPEPLLEARKIVKSFGRVQALRGANFTRLSRARSSRWSATTAPASRTLVKTLVGVAPARQRRDPLRGQAGRHRHAAAGARARDRDRLPGPRAGGRDRPRREHVPRPRDPAPRPARQARLPRQGRDAPAQRRGVPRPRRRASRTPSARVANMSGGQRQGIAICRAVTWAEQGRVHGRADRRARRRADPQRARADQARARPGPRRRPDQPQHAGGLRGRRPHRGAAPRRARRPAAAERRLDGGRGRRR